MDTQRDEVFKFLIVRFGFFKSKYYEPIWIDQVRNINEYWNMLVHDINREELLQKYMKECKETLDLDVNIEKTLGEWRIELMTRVANKIAQFAVDEVEGEFVRWNGKQMEFIYKFQYKNDLHNSHWSFAS